MEKTNEEINVAESTFSRFKAFVRRRWKFIIMASIILFALGAYAFCVQNESTNEASADTEKVRKRKRMNDYLKNFK